MVEGTFIVILGSWATLTLVWQNGSINFPAVGVTVAAMILALMGLVMGRTELETFSLLTVGGVFVWRNVLTEPGHTSQLFLFVVVMAFVLLLSRQRSFFTEISESVKGGGEIEREIAVVARNSSLKLGGLCTAAYLASVMLYSLSIESTAGLTSIWTALLFSLILLVSLLVLSLLPR